MHFVMVAMVIGVECVPCYSFFLKADFLVDLDSPVVIGYHGQSDSMEPSFLRQPDGSLRHRCSETNVLKVLVEIDEEFCDTFASRKGERTHLQVSNNAVF